MRTARGDAAVTVEWRGRDEKPCQWPRLLEGLECSPETTGGPSRAVCSQRPLLRGERLNGFFFFEQVPLNLNFLICKMEVFFKVFFSSNILECLKKLQGIRQLRVKDTVLNVSEGERGFL